jgi:hypothetical protein
MKTLSYLCSEQGFQDLYKWIISENPLKSINDTLMIYWEQINSTAWLDHEKRAELFDKIRTTINNEFNKIYDETADSHYKNWIDSIQQYCFQGGYGHSIKYNGYIIPNHWCVCIEHYDKVKNIPESVLLAALINDRYIKISSQPEHEVWTN